MDLCILRIYAIPVTVRHSITRQMARHRADRITITVMIAEPVTTIVLHLCRQAETVQDVTALRREDHERLSVNFRVQAESAI
jgi:hypothetical protein